MCVCVCDTYRYDTQPHPTLKVSHYRPILTELASLFNFLSTLHRLIYFDHFWIIKIGADERICCFFVWQLAAMLGALVNAAQIQDP